MYPIKNPRSGLVVFIASLMALTLRGQSIIEIGSSTDLWDVSRGTAITAVSGVASPYHVENAFGGRLPTVFGAQLFDHIFTDNRPAGYVHYIEWRTTNAVAVRSFHLHAQGDGADVDNGREFDRFTLKTKSPGSSSFDRVLYTSTFQHPFRFKDYSQRLLVAANVAPVLASEFRAEFTDRGNRFWSGPRVIELDGFDQRLPLEVHPAVELVWATELGRRYQVQWTDSLSSDIWNNLGSVIEGTGKEWRNFDATSSAQGVRYYRMVELP